MIGQFNPPYLGANNQGLPAGDGSVGSAGESPTKPPISDAGFIVLNNAWEWLTGKAPATDDLPQAPNPDTGGDRPQVVSSNDTTLALLILGGIVGFTIFLNR